MNNIVDTIVEEISLEKNKRREEGFKTNYLIISDPINTALKWYCNSCDRGHSESKIEEFMGMKVIVLNEYTEFWRIG